MIKPPGARSEPRRLHRGACLNPSHRSTLNSTAHASCEVAVPLPGEAFFSSPFKYTCRPQAFSGRSLYFRTFVSPLRSFSVSTGSQHRRPPPLMQGIMRLKEAIERHRENKDITLKYKTPLTSKSAKLALCYLTSLTRPSPVRNKDTFDDEQRIQDACDPLRFSRNVRISTWVRSLQGVSWKPPPPFMPASR